MPDVSIRACVECGLHIVCENGCSKLLSALNSVAELAAAFIAFFLTPTRSTCTLLEVLTSLCATLADHDAQGAADWRLRASADRDRESTLKCLSNQL